MGSLWGHFGVTLRDFGVTLGTNWGQLWHIRVNLEPYGSHYDIEKPQMAHVMAICAGLVGPKSENVEKLLVFQCF